MSTTVALSSETGYVKFVAHIHRLCATSPSARANLRRAERRSPEEANAATHKVLARWLPRDPSPGRERAYYTVAALIAAQPTATHHRNNTITSPEAGGSEEPTTSPEITVPDEPTEAARWWELPTVGVSLARAAVSRPSQPQAINPHSAEQHLRVLCRQSLTGLHRHLPVVIRRLNEVNASPDWVRLLHDLCRWEHTPRLVAKEWLQDFYRTLIDLDPDTADNGE
ncbi:type I-E CRISPR-associated protein Cse2/CasB [Crossiella sp. CA-258035]|uniref:type I-E CRISPR-associated protein Cse2/CasB n=1 Tax=Crossiella sp. CA-258035 TaxID=2981138 RepID=UPI0024BC12CC|nr:type I-E CRISPR-associated protein Cse2/CasB [Crossiella sp. CA-258035]WHT17412.1 type I-E CRISPR-associated protein Cse2/CasB [Crossiella sp. CA-258035]